MKPLNIAEFLNKVGGMFVQDNVTKRIEIHEGTKYRDFCFYDMKDYVEFYRKVERKTNLYSRTMYSIAGGTGFSVRLYSKRILVKNKNPFNIQGKYLSLSIDNRGDTVLQEIKVTRNDSFFLPEYEKLNEKLFSFIKNKDFYTENKLFYRLGMLLYGFPGNGKTSWLRWLLNNNILPKDTTVIWCKELPGDTYIQAFKTLPGIKIFIFEEITAMTNHPDAVREFLQFMDGEQTLDNSVYIATTNHPEQLPQNVVERPGRFDLIFEMDNPGLETREVILKNYFKDKFEPNMILDSEGLSHAEIKEAFISSVLNQGTFKDAVKNAKKHKQFVKNGFEKYKKIGFSNE